MKDYKTLALAIKRIRKQGCNLIDKIPQPIYHEDDIYHEENKRSKLVDLFKNVGVKMSKTKQPNKDKRKPRKFKERKY